jgi:hypothetical protein
VTEDRSPTTPEQQRRELEQMRRWKSEALPVIAGLQEVGRALGLRLGEQITGRAAVDAALDLRNENDWLLAQLTNRERDHAEQLAEQATLGDTGLCRNCAEPIWFEEGEVGGNKRVGWSDRITRGGDSLVCFRAVHYRHVPIIGRERFLWDKALELVEAVLAEPHDRQWWPVEPYADPPNDDEVVEVAVVDVARVREALAAGGLTREVRHGS